MMTASGHIDKKRIILLALDPEDVRFLSDGPDRRVVTLTGSSVNLPDVDEIRIMVATSREDFLKMVAPNIDEHTEIRGIPDGMKQ